MHKQGEKRARSMQELAKTTHSNLADVIAEAERPRRKAMGHGMDYYDLTLSRWKKYALSEKQITEAVREGELRGPISRAKITERFDYHAHCSGNAKTPIQPAYVAGVAAEYGVLCGMLPGDSVTGFWDFLQDGSPIGRMWPALFFTDFHLIALWNNESLVIPLEKVDEFRVVDRGGKLTRTETTYRDASVIKGAIVGGAIAGPAGAVVGAVHNKDRKVVDSKGHVYENHDKDFVLTVGGSTIVFEKAIQKSKDLTGYVDLKSDTDEFNKGLYARDEQALEKKVSELIERAKENRSSAKRREIVEARFEKTKRNKLKFSIILGGIWVVLIALLIITIGLLL